LKEGENLKKHRLINNGLSMVPVLSERRKENGGGRVSGIITSRMNQYNNIGVFML
jgi:hypothetical protein